ncbi:fibronectin type III domain-containing protein [Candidatus Jorgensenbacteria bacterium]|nr:fibronectin type III domain-containing protein [Candidatus Jorgensenbacteria bacterium]
MINRKSSVNSKSIKKSAYLKKTAILFAVLLFIYGAGIPEQVEAATFTFTQTAWSVPSPLIANATSGWTYYISKDANVDIGAGGLTLQLSIASTTQTDDGTSASGFNLAGAIFSSTTVMGSGSVASVGLRIVSSGDLDGIVGISTGPIHYFRNDGKRTSTAPEWDRIWFYASAQWLGLDIGSYINPFFLDIDRDNDFDMAVGENTGMVNFFENTGNVTTPQMTLRTTNWFGFDPGLDAFPAFADIDRDGDLDAVVGDNIGLIYFYENRGLRVGAQGLWDIDWAQRSTNWLGRDVGTDASITLGDIDNDGDFDAAVGSNDGLVQYYRNNDATHLNLTPSFTFVTSNFTGVDAGGDSSPEFVDLDRDGDLDLAVGNGTGVTLFFENIGTVSTPTWTQRPSLFSGIDVGTNSTPSFVDIDGDSTYSSLGVFTSGVIDAGFTSARPYTLSYNRTLPANTALSIDIRAGDTTFAGDTTWTPWLTNVSSGVLGNISSLGNHRYIQYRAALSTANVAITPTLDSISVSYKYNSSGVLLGSIYDTGSIYSLVSGLVWDESLVSGSSATVSLRTAPVSSTLITSTSTGWFDINSATPGCNKVVNTVTCSITAIPPELRSGSDDRFSQYKIGFTSNGDTVPTVSRVQVQYAINAVPEFNPNYPTAGAGGVSAFQIATTTDLYWGRTLVRYSVRDPDTTVGTVTPGFVTPSFEYNLGSGWFSIQGSTLLSGDTSNKAVSATSYSAYTATWNVKTQIPNIYNAVAQIRATVNDNESFNNVAQAVSTTVIDTRNPVINAFTLNSQLDSVSINATDDSSPLQMSISDTANSTGWITYSSSRSWNPTASADGTETVNLQIRDKFNNISSAITKAPAAVQGVTILDASDPGTNQWREQINWNQYSTATSGVVFSNYQVYRATVSTGPYTAVSPLITNVAQTSYVDTGLSSSTVYYYRVVVTDTDGDVSNYSSAVFDQPDGGTKIQFGTLTSSGGENTGSVTLPIMLSGITASNVTVNYAVSGGTATAGSDYTLASGVATIPSGSLSTSITLTVTDDGFYEGSETIVIGLSNPSGATLGANSSHTYSILDNDASPSVFLVTTSSSVGEVGTTQRIEARLSQMSGVPVIAYFTIGGSAVNGSDYMVSPSPIIVPIGSVSSSIAVTPQDDSLYEGNETVVVTLSTSTGATLGLPTIHTVTIIENDNPPSLFINDVSITEGNSGTAPATFTISLSALSLSTTTVSYATFDGTAFTPTDYSGVSGTLVFSPGQTSKTVSVSVQGDTLYESDETFSVVLSNPQNASVSRGTGVGTIVNNDVIPTIQFGISAASGAENVLNVIIPITLSSLSTQAVSVNYAATGGTATASSDYVLAAGTATVNAGATSTSVTLSIVNDAVDEPDETVIVSLSNPNGAILGSPAAYTYTITDNDVMPNLSINDVSVSESNSGTTSAIFNITLSASSAQTVAVLYGSTDGTALASTDYMNTSGTLTFTPGETTKSVTVAVNGDTTYETDETFSVVLSSPSNATIARGTGQGTITNDDILPTVQFGSAVQSGLELIVSVSVPVTLSTISPNPVSVNYAVTGGTATNGVDYALSAGTAIINPGSLNTSFSINITNDVLDEIDETIVVTLSNPNGANLGTPVTYSYMILDDDVVPEVRWSVASSNALENSNNVNLRVEVSTALTSPITLPYTLSGSALNGIDYTITPSPLIIPVGATSSVVVLTLNDDVIYEGDETVVTTFGTPTNATLGLPSAHMFTVTDNETRPVVQFLSAVSSGREDLLLASVGVTLSNQTTQSVTVAYAVTGGTATPDVDFVLASGNLTIPAFATSTSISFTVTNDNFHESDETVVVTLSDPLNADLGVIGTHTYTIADDDQIPTLSIGNAQVLEGNIGAAALNFPISLSEAAAEAVTVTYVTVDGTAVSPADYLAATGTVTFAPGETSKNISITVNSDTSFEPDESFTVMFGNVQNVAIGDGEAVGTILNDDQLPTVQFSTDSSSGRENITSVVMSVILSQPSNGPVTVTYDITGGTASPENDYVAASGTIVIPIGATQGSVFITVNNDNIHESDETTVVTLSGPVGATLGQTKAHTYTIIDDDVIGGVSVDGVRSTVAAVSWTTVAPGTSVVEYSPTGPTYDLSKSDTNLIVDHKIYLANLFPATPYFVRVRSVDQSGAEFVDDNSGGGYTFTTTPGAVITAVTPFDVFDTRASIAWYTDIPSNSFVTYATSSSFEGGVEIGDASLVQGDTGPYEHRVILNNLEPTTTYYFKVKSVDGQGNIAEEFNGGRYYSFVTTQDVSPPIISNVASPVITNSSVVVFWQTNELADSEVEYGTVSGIYSNQTTINTTPALTHTAVLLNLLSETTYYYRVISKDNLGNISRSVEQSIKTSVPGNINIQPVSNEPTVAQALHDALQAEFNKVKNEFDALIGSKDTTPPVLSSIAATDVKAFSVVITWQTNELSTSFVKYGQTTSYGLTAGLPELTKDHSLLIKGLKMGTIYHFKISSADAKGNITASDDFTFTTLFAAEDLEELIKTGDLSQFEEKLGKIIESMTPSLVPPVISDVTVKGIGETGAIITWRTNIDGSSFVALASETDYKPKNAAPYVFEIGTADKRVKDHEVALTNLKSGTRYHFQVKSQNILGIFGKGKDLTFTTKFDKPDLVVTDLKEMRVTIQWATEKPTTSQVEYRDVKTGKLLKSGDETSVRSHIILLTGLTPDTTYEVKGLGYDDQGNLIETRAKSFKTTIDIKAPAISNLKIENALIPTRTDRLQTIVFWKTDEPATSQVFFEEGPGQTEKLSQQTPFQETLTIDHVVVLTLFKPSTVYRIQVVSTDGSGNRSVSPIQSVLTPQKGESIVDIITRNFEQSFGWLKFVR